MTLGRVFNVIVSHKLIQDIYQSHDESSSIIVYKGNDYLGEWEVEEWDNDTNYNGEKAHVFQLIPFLHISLTQHPNTMYSSWTVLSNHVVSYQIDDRNIRLDYEENRISCGSVNAVIPLNSYKKLKQLFRSYFNLLNTDSGSGNKKIRTVMNAFPYGGTSVLPYSYHIGDKLASFVAPLFIGEPNNVTSSFNMIINDITNAI